jgi:hypothetical protein
MSLQSDSLSIPSLSIRSRKLLRPILRILMVLLRVNVKMVPSNTTTPLHAAMNRYALVHASVERTKPESWHLRFCCHRREALQTGDIRLFRRDTPAQNCPLFSLRRWREGFPWGGRTMPNESVTSPIDASNARTLRLFWYKA